MNIEQNYTLKQTGSISKFLKFFIPSLLGLFLFIIPLPFGKIFNVSGVSPVNIGVGFISELLKLAIGDYIPTICLVIIVLSASLSLITKIVMAHNGLPILRLVIICVSFGTATCLTCLAS